MTEGSRRSSVASKIVGTRWKDRYQKQVNSSKRREGRTGMYTLNSRVALRVKELLPSVHDEDGDRYST